MPVPTLEKDVPTRVNGSVALRYVARTNSIALELGSDSNALIAFDCSEPAQQRSDRVDLFAEPRGCYRCALAIVDQGPQDPYGPQPLDATLMEIARTLRRYPGSFVRASDLKSLALCTTLVAPPSAELERLAGLADTSRQRMLVRLQPDDHAIAEVVHHEMYHLFDSATYTAQVDPAWDALNPRDFKYGGAKSASGFVDAYAQTNAREDKASTFATMMSDGDGFCARAQIDPIVKAKGALVLHRIATVLPDGDAMFVTQKVPCI